MLRFLRFVAGAAIAAALWWYLAPAYNEFLCRVLRFRNPSVETIARNVYVDRAGAPRVSIPADQLTYNFVLFAGLMAAVPPRRVWRALAALAALIVFHVLALYATIEAAYATSGGAWANEHYSPLAQDFWNSASFVYRLAGMFAIAFVSWYLAAFPLSREPQRETPRKSAKGGRASRRAESKRR